MIKMNTYYMMEMHIGYNEHWWQLYANKLILTILIWCEHYSGVALLGYIMGNINSTTMEQTTNPANMTDKEHGKHN